MQEMIIADDREEFEEQVNNKLSEGYTVIPGTTHASFLSEDMLYAAALWRADGQIFVTASDWEVFKGEVNNHLSEGFCAIPGTTYFANVGQIKSAYILSSVYCVFLNKD